MKKLGKKKAKVVKASVFGENVKNAVLDEGLENVDDEVVDKEVDGGKVEKSDTKEKTKTEISDAKINEEAIAREKEFLEKKKIELAKEREKGVIEKYTIVSADNMDVSVRIKKNWHPYCL